MLVRPLLASEADAFRDHLLRLDLDSRRFRFFRPVNDGWIRFYVADYAWSRAHVVGAFDGGVLCGVCEVVASANDPSHGDLGISVELPHRRQGIGKALLEAAVLRARTGGVRSLAVSSLPENAALKALLAPYRPTSRFEAGVAESTLALSAPDLGELLEEQGYESIARLHKSALDVGARLDQAARMGEQFRQTWRLLLTGAGHVA